MSAEARAALAGDWATSYSGYSLFDPKATQAVGETEAAFLQRVARLPPMIGGYRWFPPRSFWPYWLLQLPERWDLKDGYFLFTALMRLRLHADGMVSGLMQFIRGNPVGGLRDRKIIQAESSFSVDLDTDYPADQSLNLPGHYAGLLTETHDIDGGNKATFTYSLVVRSADEIEYCWKEGTERPILATGTLRRMSFSPTVITP